MSLFQYDFTVSFLEIYNEVIRDLLGSGKDDAKHEIRLVAAGSSEVYVTDLTTVTVSNKEQVCIINFVTVDCSAVSEPFYVIVQLGVVVALQRAEMRMVRWMCGVKLKDRLPSKELRERLGVDDIALVLQQNRLSWYGHVLRKDDDDWVKKCMEHEVEGSRPRPGKRLYVRTVKHVS